MRRRRFLQLGGGGCASVLAVAGWLEALGANAAAATTSGKVLVWLELRGGNDGLNTVIPFRNPIYRQSRPTLALGEGPALSRDLILHPALAPLYPVWQARRLAFALGVGWPMPNRSHFKAMDQWATGTTSGTGTGWVAAAIDQRGSSGPLVALGPSGSTALEGGRALNVQIAPALLLNKESQTLNPSRAVNNSVLRKMLEIEWIGNQEIQKIRRSLAPVPSGLGLPRGDLGGQVALALRLIASGAAPPVIQLSQSGYDTHADQAAGLERLPQRPPVTLLAVSEFGRRLHENGSGGTDHGSASVALLLEDRGDLIASLSPPELYRQVLQVGV